MLESPSIARTLLEADFLPPLPDGKNSKKRLPNKTKGKVDNDTSNGETIVERIRERARVLPYVKHIKAKASYVGITDDLYVDLSRKFYDDMMAGNIEGCNEEALSKIRSPPGYKRHIDSFLLPHFLDYCEPRLPKEAEYQFKPMRKTTDLRFPHEWYPEARKMQRNIHLHVGPTNSGKTYSALKRLTEAKSGIYCGPLRLLAHEIFDRMNGNGIPCNLVTGEEKKIVDENATLTSSTVEMVDLNRNLEVAVVDEIQMIGDRSRGWAWTQALLGELKEGGLRAEEIHLCGEASVVPLVQEICDGLNDTVEVHHYERLTPLTISKKSLNGSYKNVKKGDCVVTFARKDIFEVKRAIEKETGLRCAVVYGALPPESRALQAKSFNDEDNEIDVLVASDAVGMGLNLNIKRIVFESVQKYNGVGFTHINPPHLKQIAGRAGRFGTAYANGEVTTLDKGDLPYVHKAMQAPIQYLKAAGVHPTVDIIELFGAQITGEKFSELLAIYEGMAKVGEKYFLCTYGDSKEIAEKMDSMNLSLRDRYQFVSAPTPIRDKECVKAVADMASAYSRNEKIDLKDLINLPAAKPTNEMASKLKLEELESCHKVIMIYMWLGMRFPDHFVTAPEEAAQIKERTELLIDKALRRANTQDLQKRRQVRKFGKPKSTHK
ncbi:hypothetical protein INT43_003984 [Umbelopsis isabellina]|uniref:RNA helicase n=1 Tax=Mortierella isabellina TaxID=91625 RepID=A0A8H7PUW5_MORIS|nr:hypothetical protein INT43_003984 [Umbelopsis isabellina]